MFAMADYSSRYSIGFGMIGIVLFVLLVAFVPALYFMPRRWRVASVVALIVAYSGSYAALSVAGDYFWSQSGTRRYSHTGMAITDCLVWYPKGLYWEPFVDLYGTSTSRGTPLGYFFMPMLKFDRAWFHPTKRFPEDFPFE
jgi:hypothetical protein